jgi:ABC-type nitrate/sulfonate/bicarbonate transport system substrate-binding protein
MYNFRNGKASPMGPYWAAWRYALRNPKEAYPAWEKWAKEYLSELAEQGIEINFEKFLEEIKEHARRGAVVGENAYKKFCAEWQLEP